MFNDILNTFYDWLYAEGYVVKDHLDNMGENVLPTPHGLGVLITIQYNKGFNVLIQSKLL